MSDLRALAEAVADEDDGWNADYVVAPNDWGMYGVVDALNGVVVAGTHEQLAEFFAAASPRVVLGHLDEIDTLRARLADQQAVIDAALSRDDILNEPGTDDEDWLSANLRLALHVDVYRQRQAARLTDKGDG